MATPHSVDLEMDLIMSSPPSVLRNSTVTFVIRILTFIIGFVALVGGLGLLISSSIQKEIVNFIFEGGAHGGQMTSQIERISVLLGIGLIILGLLFLLISRLTKMILKRNGFILKSCIRWEELR